MKKTRFLLAIIAILVGLYSFIPAKKATEILNVSTANSKIEWLGSKPSGYHTGTFSLKDGQVILDNGKLTGGKFTIDLTSLKVTDAVGGERLEGHLKSPDFFDVAKFGEASFEITSVNYTSVTNCNISGNLSMRGIVVPLKIPAIIRNAAGDKFFGQAFFQMDKAPLAFAFTKAPIASDVQIRVSLFAGK